MWNTIDINTVADFDTLESEWNTLAKTSPFSTVFNLHGFSKAWLWAFANDWYLHINVFRDARGAARLIAPFVAAKKAPLRWFLLGHGASDYESPLYRAGDTEAIAAFSDWLKEKRQWISIEMNSVEKSYSGDWLPLVDRNSNRYWNAFQLLGSAFPLGYRIQDEQHPYFTHRDFAKLTKKTQSRDYRKHTNWFSKRGPLTYLQCRTPQEIEPHWNSVFDLHIKKWEHKGPGSLFSTDANRNFLRALPNHLFTEQACRLDLLLWNDKPVAAHFGFHWNERLYWYVTTYDPDVGNHSPGKLLLAQVIQRADQDGLKEIDFLRGQEAYKYDYATEVRKTARLTFYRTRSALLENWVSRTFPALRRRVRFSP